MRKISADFLQGPTLAYMKKVDDALTDDGIGDGWFKVEAAGLTNVASKNLLSENSGLHSIDFYVR